MTAEQRWLIVTLIVLVVLANAFQTYVNYTVVVSNSAILVTLTND